VQWPAGNPLWTGIAVDPFVIQYQQAAPIPEPAAWALLLFGILTVVRVKFRGGNR
jgi:hypothetical protein